MDTFIHADRSDHKGTLCGLLIASICTTNASHVTCPDCRRMIIGTAKWEELIAQLVGAVDRLTALLVEGRSK